MHRLIVGTSISDAACASAAKKLLLEDEPSEERYEALVAKLVALTLDGGRVELAIQGDWGEVWHLVVIDRAVPEEIQVFPSIRADRRDAPAVHEGPLPVRVPLEGLSNLLVEEYGLAALQVSGGAMVLGEPLVLDSLDRNLEGLALLSSALRDRVTLLGALDEACARQCLIELVPGHGVRLRPLFWVSEPGWAASRFAQLVGWSAGALERDWVPAPPDAAAVLLGGSAVEAPSSPLTTGSVEGRCEEVKHLGTALRGPPAWFGVKPLPPPKEALRLLLEALGAKANAGARYERVRRAIYAVLCELPDSSVDDVILSGLEQESDAVASAIAYKLHAKEELLRTLVETKLLSCWSSNRRYGLRIAEAAREANYQPSAELLERAPPELVRALRPF